MSKINDIRYEYLRISHCLENTGPILFDNINDKYGPNSIVHKYKKLSKNCRLLCVCNYCYLPIKISKSHIILFKNHPWTLPKYVREDIDKELNFPLVRLYSFVYVNINMQISEWSVVHRYFNERNMIRDMSNKIIEHLCNPSKLPKDRLISILNNKLPIFIKTISNNSNIELNYPPISLEFLNDFCGYKFELRNKKVYCLVKN